MGNVNLAQIRSTVRLRGDYPLSPKFTDAYVNGEIQPAWSELYELVADTNEGWWDTKSTVTTTAGQDYVAMPATAWRIQGIDYLDGTVWRELRQVGVGDRNRWDTLQGIPVAYRLTARGADLYPTPDNVYTLRVHFTPIVTPLDESATIQLYNDWQEYVVTSALLRLDTRQQRPSIPERMQELGRVRDRIVAAATKRRQQEPEYVQLREMPSWWGWDH